jgi:hypothetical protein
MPPHAEKDPQGQLHVKTPPIQPLHLGQIAGISFLPSKFILNSKTPSSVPHHNVLPSSLIARPAVFSPASGSCAIRLALRRPRLNSYVSADGWVLRTLRRRSRICVSWRRRRSSFRSSGAVVVVVFVVLGIAELALAVAFASRACVDNAASMVRHASSVEATRSLVSRRACAGITTGERVVTASVMLVRDAGAFIVAGSIETTTEAWRRGIVRSCGMRFHLRKLSGTNSAMISICSRRLALSLCCS